ncbi:hypothetical protein OY671_011120, partial [Metschnikowia pulcherrima]
RSAHDPDRHLRHHPRHRRYFRRMARRQARRPLGTEAGDHGQYDGAAVCHHRDPPGRQGFDFLHESRGAGAGCAPVLRRGRARLSRAWSFDRRRRWPAASGVAHAAHSSRAKGSYRAIFRTVRADRKGDIVHRAAVDRRDYGDHGEPEGGDGDPGAVLRRRAGAAGAG